MREAFTVTHPFHPLSGQEFELVGYAHTWGEHRVFFRQPGEERVHSLPAGWTDVEGVDPFLVIAGRPGALPGRGPPRPGGPVCASSKARRRKVHYAAYVRRILPKQSQLIYRVARDDLPNYAGNRHKVDLSSA